MELTDEFASLIEVADEFTLPRAIVPVAERREVQLHGGGHVSAIAWGRGAPQIVFIHGGGQNAHTWDSVVTLLGRPALGVDLPGHGHSSWRDDREYRAPANAVAVAVALQQLAPEPLLVVGMSLGGMTAINLAARWPELVPRLMLVDILPRTSSATRRLNPDSRGAVALIDGPKVFDSQEHMVSAAVKASPSRAAAATRRGVVNNSVQLPDGSWRWRYDDLRIERDDDATVAEALWGDLAGLEMPTMLVRGGSSEFVSDDDLARFHELRPDAASLVIPHAGHSVQSDQPVALAATIASFLLAPPFGAALG
ncbi:MAG: alpha/beta hydrolase [Actinomycetota bacterium]